MNATKNLLITTGALTLAVLLAALEAGAQCSVFSCGYGGRPWPGSSIGVLAGEGVSEADIRGAIAIWERGCTALYAAGRIPQLLANRPGDRTVRVDLDAKVSPRQGVCGTFNAASITIWSFTVRDNKAVTCGPAARLIAHELGHVLGLGDAPARRECCNHIMSHIWLDRLRIDRAMPSECEVVAAANVPGLGLGGEAATLVAADLTGGPASVGEATVADAATSVAAVAAGGAEALPGGAAQAENRLARFLAQRTAARRGWSASRNVP